LDENFFLKIFDFELAKLCPRNESIIAMSNARGTKRYVAPKIWSRHIGGVSHISDVYSYEMMLLEMVEGGRTLILKLVIQVRYTSHTGHTTNLTWTMI